MKRFTRATSSSAVVRGLRRYTAGSVVCRAVIASTKWPTISRWLRETRQRIVIGLGGEWSDEQERRTVEQLDALTSGSRIVAVISSCVTPAFFAWRESALRRALNDVMSGDVDHKIRTGGFAIIVAVLTHTLLLWLLGVPVQALGWGSRLFLLAIGTAGLFRADAVAAAWRNRSATK